MKQTYVLLSVIAMIVLQSCGSNIDIVKSYKYQTNIDSLTISALDPIIQKNDIISINVSVAGSEEGQRIMELYSGSKSGGNLMSSGYLVSPSGFITVPVIGEVEAAGKTKLEIINTLQQKFKKYIGAIPLISIRILNFRVYIEGEVSRPGSIDVQNEVISLQEAIAIAGGTTTYAILGDVELVRRINGVTHIEHINLQGDEIYTTKKEFYYLKQGDYIQIKANKEKFIAANASTGRTIAYATSALTILITLFTLLR